MKIKVLSLLSVLLLSACSNATITPADPNPTPHDIEQGEGAFSEDGNILSGFKGFGFGSKSESTSSTVNTYVWRSALQAVSFMPLTQADSAGGVILSDWMSQEGDVNKQVKVNIYILSKRLEANSLDVKVFSRTKLEDGTYSAQKIDKATSTALEETILTNARELKIRELSK